MKKPKEIPHYSDEVLDKYAREKREDRRYYRNLILRTITTFCMGIILSAFLEALGLFGFLFGFLLCVFGFCFAKLL